MRYLILVDVQFREPIPDAASIDGSRQIAGYFMSVGVEGNSTEEAVRRAKTAALAPDAATGWRPPAQYDLGKVEISPTGDHDDAAVNPDGVFFQSGRTFYPAKAWWEFWK